jgi:diguanylate cyclase (GGDEF)-like protein
VPDRDRSQSRFSRLAGKLPGAGAWRRHPAWATVPAAAIGVVLSLLAWSAMSQREHRLAQVEFAAHVDNHAMALQSGIDDYLDSVAALQALFQSVKAVSRQEFQTFSESLLRGQTAMLGTSWIPRITRDEREAHEQTGASEGLPGYHIKAASQDRSMQRAPEAADYYPVFYASAEPPESPVYGLDLNDGGFRQRTLERARDQGRMAASGIFRLTARVKDRNGLFVVLPVYRHGLPHVTLPERRANLRGFVQGVFQTGVMIDTILRTSTAPGGLDMYFFDADAAPTAGPLYFHPSRLSAAPVQAQPRSMIEAGRHATRTIAVGDRHWTLIAVPTGGGPAAVGQVASRLVLFGGLALTALVAAYLWAAAQHARRMHAANDELDRANARFDAALNNMSQGLVMFDADERVVVCNDRYIDMYALARDVVKPGCSLRHLLYYRHAAGNLGRDPEQYRTEIITGLAQKAVTSFVHETGDGRTISVANSPMAGGGWVATHEDITERRRAEAEVAYMARHDALTGLPNRPHFREQANAMLGRAKRGEDVAILCLDIDHFKSVNDTLGHPLGDLLLRAVADRLRECVRETDLIARLGGDEFAIVQVGAAQPTGATNLASRLIDAVGAPYDLDGHQLVVGLSIGIALAPADGSESRQLLKNADMALYRAKSDGRGVYRFFEPAMGARMQARRRLESDLRNALAAGEFVLHYQPLVDARTEHIRGFEALIRWCHPQRGMIAPSAFIPLAEETGMIVPLGEWVLRQACQEAAAWPGDLSVAVNLSPAQFKGRKLVAAVTGAIAAASLAPSRLELEITESVLLQDGEGTIATLHQLRAAGIRISMDDFGTGYSSLGYLRTFPFDKIKIDRSFIHDMPERGDSLAIVRAVAAISSSLGMTTTAEGVETRDQFEQLRKEGLTEVQGNLFSPPRPATELADLVASFNRRLKAIA